MSPSRNFASCSFDPLKKMTLHQELTTKFELEKADAAAKFEDFRQQATAQEDLLRGYLRTSEARVESLTR
jgi:hypothetical protein